MKPLEEMSKDERSLLLFLETQAVDYGGTIEACRMNGEDFATAKQWNIEGFIEFGRIYSKDLDAVGRGGRRATHWVQLSDEAWRYAGTERQNRYNRIADKRTWRKTAEAGK